VNAVASSQGHVPTTHDGGGLLTGFYGHVIRRHDSKRCVIDDHLELLGAGFVARH